MIIHCPKCGYSRKSTDSALPGECPACGVVFAEFLSARRIEPTLSPDGLVASRGAKAAPVAVPTAAKTKSTRQRNLLIALGIAFLIFSVVMSREGSNQRPAPPNSNVSPEVQYAVQAAVKHAGYRCDSLSGVVSHVFTAGYRVTCNEHRYAYSIEDRGGRWVVTLD